MVGRQGSALAHGATANAAFVSGYALALEIGAAVLLVGALLALAFLRAGRAYGSMPALEPTG